MNSSIPKQIRAPVHRVGAEHYLLVMLLSFASAVLLTRLFLELTGYPQFGGGDLHIAHVLWGGLLLFASTLSLLMMSNRRSYPLAAAIGGVGVGLFVDEVGQFITRTNDYFHPVAAPIIYATFLLTVLLYLRVRRPKSFDTRSELYWALETLQEVLDHDLEQHEYHQLEHQLNSVAEKTGSPVYRSLSAHLLDFLHSEHVVIVSVETGWLTRLFEMSCQLGRGLFSPVRLKAALIGGLAALGLWELWDLVQLLMAAQDPARFREMVVMWNEFGDSASITSIFWFVTRVVIEGSAGFLMAISTLLLIFRRERAGSSLGVLSLIFSLTTVNLVAFYVDQFSTILVALIQFILLLTALLYQSRLEDLESGDDLDNN